MASVIHIAEIAAILAVAYMLGWLVGYLAHRLVARQPAAAAAIPEERLAAATGADPLVMAPVIVPVADPGAPETAPEPARMVTENSAVATDTSSTAPEPVLAVAEPVPSGVEPPPVVADAAPVLPVVQQPSTEAVPVVEAGPTPEAVPAPAEPVVSEEPKPAPVPPETAPPLKRTGPSFRRFKTGVRVTVSTNPVPEPVPANFTATPATRPGIAWTGEIKGRQATPHSILETAPAEIPAPVPAPVEVPIESTHVEPAPEPAQVAEQAAAPKPAPVYDEDAAMRAIEGGWSRVKARAMADTPELSDMGAAVAAATTAVEQVLARAGIDVDAASQGVRPKGLPRPRNGRRDDLKRIAGLGALDESTLNNLGVNHYDQIADWNDAQVLWMENHVFARGRIGREDWQRQARELTARPVV